MGSLRTLVFFFLLVLHDLSCVVSLSLSGHDMFSVGSLALSGHDMSSVGSLALSEYYTTPICFSIKGRYSSGI